jgi:hypothetical protein
MAKQSIFEFDNISVSAELKKVDRKKIYGWSIIEVFDENNAECDLAGIADGSIVLPKGSTALKKLDVSGEEINSKELVGVDMEGNKVDLVPSIYDKPVKLKKATINDYLSLAVKSVYQLIIEGEADKLIASLDNDVYYFVFNYRSDYEGDDAFLLAEGKNIFAVVGKIADFEFIGFKENENELTVVDESEEDTDLDFAMF